MMEFSRKFRAEKSCDIDSDECRSKKATGVMEEPIEPKGISISVKRLGDLHEAVTKAHAKAVELGLLVAEGEDGE